MLNNPLLITLLVLVGGALVSGFLKGRERDRVLKGFAGHHVTLETLKGRLVWGELVLHSTGMELIYRSDLQDEHHVETSYILYKDEFAQIQAIYRYCDEMGSEQWATRQRELESTYHPGFWRRLQRRMRNALNLVADSLSQAIGILVGQIQSSSKRISAGSDAYLSKVGASIIGYVGTRYDPLLERYVGTKVVVEVTEGDTVHEHIGILKDYTADFLEILDVHYPNQTAIHVAHEASTAEDRHVCVTRKGETLHVKNVGEQSLYLQRLRAGDQSRSLNAVLDQGDELELHLPPDTGEAGADLEIKVVRHLDWIVPRSHALIRHKAERYDPDQVFDIGVLLRLERHTDEEERYLRTLQENAGDAPSAVALAQLLFQRGALEEAKRWFRQALHHRSALPDGGKLAERQLRSIEQKGAAQSSRT